ncbi:MAG TPA: SRPBCC family protein [Clostridia bacterium]|nr:SRPBCC family protein [Clostridia bacterium]
MATKVFWGGFAAGAAAGLGTLWAVSFIGRGGKSRIIRFEKAVQIGRPVHEVFDAWSDYSRLPQYSSLIQSVTRSGDRSHWVINLDGKPFEWDAEITQLIPNEAIGWKSVAGAKNTGRISFSPIGNDTLMNVVMNYAPPARMLRPFFSAMSGRIEGRIDQAVRDFKAALEGKGQENVTRPLAGGSSSGSTDRQPSQATAHMGRVRSCSRKIKMRATAHLRFPSSTRALPTRSDNASRGVDSQLPSRSLNPFFGPLPVGRLLRF